LAGFPLNTAQPGSGGAASIASRWEDVFDVFPDLSSKIEEIQDLGDTTITQVQLHGQGIGSDAPAEQTRAAVQSTIRFTLNELPEEPYPEKVWDTKVEAVWSYVFSRSQQGPVRPEVH